MHSCTGSFRILRLLVFTAVLSVTLAAQEEIPPPPIEWGDIPRTDLEMTSYPADSLASAVVLCDFGETTMESNFNLKFTRHLRVKILNEKGFRWGTMSLTISTDRNTGERVEDIEGVTYVLGPDGKVKEFELDEDDVFEEEVTDGFNRHKFTLPGLTPGCVIEIRYSIIAKSMARIRGWVFQDDDPVLWSEYRLLHPTPIVFAALSRGYERLHIEKHFEIKKHFSGDVAIYYGDNLVRCHFWQWAMKGIPALRDEAYITTLTDYTSRIELQLSAYAIRGGGIQQVLSTWEKFITEMLKDEDLGGMIADADEVKDLAVSLTDTIPSRIGKMKRLYEYVASTVSWDENQSIWARRSAEEILESRTGNCAEVNYLLTAMLRAAGISADPLILSTRGNGAIQDLYPIWKQFNYGMAYAVIDGQGYALDATDPSRPYDMLPSRVLGSRALRLVEGRRDWITLFSPHKGISTVSATITLSDNGAVSGSIDGIYRHYLNLQARASLKEKTPENFARDMFELNASGLTLDSVQLVNKDTASLPLILKASVSSDAYGQRSGDLIYVNPHMISRWSDNPFKNPVRKFPVDYNFPREYSTIVTLVLPDSFRVKELIPNKQQMLGSDAVYSRMLQVEQNRLQLISKLELKSRVIPAASYQKLRELYDVMIHAESEQIVLMKIQPPPPPPPAPEPAAPPVKPAAKKRNPTTSTKKQ